MKDQEREVLVVEVPTSRKAMPILAYVAAFIMGVLYLSDIATAASLASTSDQVSAWIWQLILLLAASVALASVLMPRRYVLRALAMESFAAGVIAAELAAYVGVLLFTPSSGSIPWATVVWLGLPVCGGLAFRAFGAMRDRRRRLLAIAAGAPS